MAKKNFIMLELDDSKTKKIANVVSNNTCRKILEHLAEKDDSTESAIAKDLNIAISTVHYNLQQLLKTDLVIADEYHYSEKGKEVLHYKLANRYIIITPKKVRGITQKLKSILPVALLSAGVAGIIELVRRFPIGKIAMTPAFQAAKESAPDMMRASNDIVTTEAVDVGYATPQVVETVAQVPEPIWQNIALWFLIGALFALGVYLLISWIRKKD